MFQGKESKSLLKALLRVVSTRIELFSLELSEEKNNLSQVLILTVVLGSFLVLFCIALLGLILALLWNTPYRYWFIGSCIVFFGAVALAALAGLKKLLFSRVPFEMTIEELKTDISSIKKSD